MKTLLLAASALLLALAPTAATAQHYFGTTVRDLNANKDENCVIFRLDGLIGHAALPRSHINFQEVFAILLTARAARIPVNVWMTGGTVCDGYHAVNAVSLKD